MALCARTACINTPGNLYTCMTCTPLISVDAKGINLDFRFEIKICTHLRGGSDITEQRLCVRICPLVHYALNYLYFYHSSCLSPPLPSISQLFLQKDKKVEKNTTLPHSSAFGFEYELIWRGRSLRFCVPVVQRKSSRINRKQ